jgi:hypothetical protein
MGKLDTSPKRTDSFGVHHHAVTLLRSFAEKAVDSGAMCLEHRKHRKTFRSLSRLPFTREPFRFTA